METVEVVIRIPKKCKEFLDNGGKVDWLDANAIIDAVANGTALPKGHGRLIDADALNFICTYDTYGCDKICYCDNCGYNVVKHREVNDASTVIEADRIER